MRAARLFQRIICVLCALCVGALITFGLTLDEAYAKKTTPNMDEDGNLVMPEQVEEEPEEVTVQVDIGRGFEDGVYYGDADGFKSVVTVAVEIKDEFIVDVEVISQSDDREYFDRALRVIPTLLTYQTPKVDAIAGASYSTRGITHAVEDALLGDGAPDAARTMAIMAATRVMAGVSALGAVGITIWRSTVTNRKRSLSALRWQRLVIQIMFFMLAPSAFGSAFMGVKLPFDQVWNSGGIQVTSFTIQLVVLLVLTALMGRFFCGYACSFGLLGDVMFQFGSALSKKFGWKRRSLPAHIERRLRYVKYIVLVAICLAVFLGAYDFVNETSPWTAFSRLSNLFVGGLTAASVVLLIAIMVGMVYNERSFCEFLCPLGALFSIVPTIPQARVAWNRPTCYKGCSACSKTCPVVIQPKDKLLAGECIACGRCAQGCPAGNIALAFEARPGESGYSTHHVLHAWMPLIKAVVLLLALWVCGALRFLPAFPISLLG